MNKDEMISELEKAKWSIFSFNDLISNAVSVDTSAVEDAETHIQNVLDALKGGK